MNMIDLTKSLLSLEECSEMETYIQMLEASDYSGFYNENQCIIQNILFIESLDEFLDFARENSLDIECYCAAFLCARGYGIQVGGYENDLTDALTKFFEQKESLYPEIAEIISREKIYTDCSDYDNFKKSMTAINQVLDVHGMRLIVLEDYIYCDCEYTVLRVDMTLAENVLSTWSSDNFEIYL